MIIIIIWINERQEADHASFVTIMHCSGRRVVIFLADAGDLLLPCDKLYFRLWKPYLILQNSMRELKQINNVLQKYVSSTFTEMICFKWMKFWFVPELS